MSFKPEPQIYHQEASWTLESWNDQKSVFVKFEDAAGNESIPYSDSIIVDTTPPLGFISIEPDDEYINFREVTLSLQAIDGLSGVERVKISEDPSFSGASWDYYTQEKEWILSNGDGTKTIYVKYEDGVGNESEVFSDETKLDMTKPIGNVIINDGAEAADKMDVILTIEGTDEFSGIDKMMVSNDESFSDASWESYHSPKLWELTEGDGEKTVYVKLKDKAGNEPDIVSDDIELK